MRNKKGGLLFEMAHKIHNSFFNSSGRVLFSEQPAYKKIFGCRRVAEYGFYSDFCLCSLFKGEETIADAFIIGSVIDLIFGEIYGVNALLLVLFTCLFYFLNRFIYSESFLSVFAYSFVATALFRGRVRFDQPFCMEKRRIFASDDRKIPDKMRV